MTDLIALKDKVNSLLTLKKSFLENAFELTRECLSKKEFAKTLGAIELAIIDARLKLDAPPEPQQEMFPHGYHERPERTTLNDFSRERDPEDLF